ncbi:MAG: leucine-rich repeat domain-containing protein [Roseburia sp.]|nr:leucine-rich repeat domain-containing protein [Roseburia sp.]
MKKKTRKKILSTLLICTLVLANSVNVLATTTEIQGSGTDAKDTGSSIVEADMPSWYTVTIPKKIIIDSESALGEYMVNVTGDIAGNMKVHVVPESNITLTQEGKDDITATISQNKTSWTFNEMGTNTSGNISAPDLSAGMWNGTLYFDITLEGALALAPGLYDANGVMLATWEEAGIDAEKTYDYSNYNTDRASGNYVLTNKYPETTKVVMPSTITKIGFMAFRECANLQSVIIPNSVTLIEGSAFEQCGNLVNVTLSDNLEEVGYQIFYYVSGIESITWKGRIYTDTEKDEFNQAFKDAGITDSEYTWI